MKDFERIFWKTLLVVMIIMIVIFSLIGVLVLFPFVQEVINHRVVNLLKYDPDTLLMIFLISLILIFMLVPMLFIVIMRDKRSIKNTGELKYKSNLDKDREYLEYQLHNINEAFSSTAKSWKDINYLLIDVQNRLQKDNTGIISPSKFLESYGIEIDKIQIDSKQVFVITPFSSMYSDTYEVIKETCQSLKLYAVRSDEEYISNSIMKYIVEKIVTSRIIIANVDGRNPNVMYELGIAHAFNKPTIIIDKGNQIRPFDIEGNQIIIYKDDKDLTVRLKEQLLNILIVH